MTRLAVYVNHGGHTCHECVCLDADEHLLYCGIFRKPLGSGSDYPPVRLRECFDAENEAKGMPYSRCPRDHGDGEP